MKFHHYCPLEKFLLATPWKTTIGPPLQNPSDAHDIHATKTVNLMSIVEKLGYKINEM